MKRSKFITYAIALVAALLIVQAASASAAQAAQIVTVIAPTDAMDNPGFGTVVKHLGTQTPYGDDQLALRVMQSVPGEVDPVTGIQRTYYQVHLPYRRSRLDSSNGFVGWVSSDHVQVKTAVYAVKVNRAKRVLTLTRYGKTYKTWRVVVGQASMPTPAGQFAVYGKTTRDHPFDGSGMLVWGYSTVLANFDSAGPGTPANGMVALHGRSGASLNDSLGSAASHGCVRMDNSNIDFLLAKLPIGTPVDVS